MGQSSSTQAKQGSISRSYTNHNLGSLPAANQSSLSSSNNKPNKLKKWLSGSTKENLLDRKNSKKSIASISFLNSSKSSGNFGESLRSEDQNQNTQNTQNRQSLNSSQQFERAFGASLIRQQAAQNQKSQNASLYTEYSASTSTFSIDPNFDRKGGSIGGNSSIQGMLNTSNSSGYQSQTTNNNGNSYVSNVNAGSSLQPSNNVADNNSNLRNSYGNKTPPKAPLQGASRKKLNRSTSCHFRNLAPHNQITKEHIAALNERDFNNNFNGLPAKFSNGIQNDSVSNMSVATKKGLTLNAYTIQEDISQIEPLRNIDRDRRKAGDSSTTKLKPATLIPERPIPTINFGIRNSSSFSEIVDEFKSTNTKSSNANINSIKMNSLVTLNSPGTTDRSGRGSNSSPYFKSLPSVERLSVNDQETNPSNENDRQRIDRTSTTKSTSSILSNRNAVSPKSHYVYRTLPIAIPTTHPALTKSSSELLICFSYYISKCLKNFESSVSVSHKIVLQWMRNIDRVLMAQGWQDEPFFNTATIVILYRICVTSFGKLSEQEMHSDSRLIIDDNSNIALFSPSEEVGQGKVVGGQNKKGLRTSYSEYNLKSSQQVGNWIWSDLF